MEIAKLILGIVKINGTFIFQIINTLILVLIIYLIYRLIKKLLGGKSKLELRVNSLEDELNDLKGKK